MKIYLSNFTARVARYLGDNRSKLIKALIIAVGALIVAALLYYGIESWQRARFERKVNALDALIRDADLRAKEAEAHAELLKSAINDKYAELRNLESRARTAESRLTETRRAVAPLKETYEKARDNPDVPADTTCADACKELAAIGHPCR